MKVGYTSSVFGDSKHSLECSLTVVYASLGYGGQCLETQLTNTPCVFVNSLECVPSSVFVNSLECSLTVVYASLGYGGQCLETQLTNTPCGGEASLGYGGQNRMLQKSRRSDEVRVCRSLQNGNVKGKTKKERIGIVSRTDGSQSYILIQPY